MFLIGLGGGGFRAIAVPFIANQQTKTEPRVITLKTGEVVVTDYQITLQYIYNLYYWVPHEQNALPKAFKIIVCACRSGFKMARADPSYQLEHRHRTVPWSAQLVDKLA
ncbi:hypothetical protein PTNB29_03702 [Pyrenophora teres f. teres]|nr:hypothetical protein PTNB29_03702 [Pyrenophora teres f. teres]